MSLTGSVYTVTSSAATTIVQPSVDAQNVVIRNRMPDGDLNQHVREGYSFAAHADFTVTQGAYAGFSLTTGDTGAQILGYTIAADASSIHAELIEGATVVTGATYPAYNLNREVSRTYDATLQLATSITGGTEISSETIYASNQASAGQDSTKRITLAPNTQYAMKFNNVGSQTANIHFEIIWTETFNGYSTVWLNGGIDEGFPLHGGDELEMTLLRGQSVTAISGGVDCEVAVMRQD